jgi:hypothetical protein
VPPLVTIPAWNPEGLLPPVDAAAPTSANRAPYAVSLADFALRFSTSSNRIEILAGFLNYRAALHAAGLTDGFQWVNGSFMENVEVCPRRKRSPNDVDVVTFFRLPSGTTQAAVAASFPELFPRAQNEHDGLEARFKVDAYLVSLGGRGEQLVDRTAYWYGVWGHQRETLKWKGFLQLDLAPTEDAAARALVATTDPGGAA